MTTASAQPAAAALGQTPPAIRAIAIAKSYPTRAEPLIVLHDLSFSLAAGRAAAIMGPSGSGKSTFLSVVGTLEPPTSGELLVAGIYPFALPAEKLAEFRNQRIGFVFQEHHLLPQLSLLENVLLPTCAGFSTNIDARPRAVELLNRVGLGQRLEHRPAELSGGERQRTAIARALINRPAVILADEPTGNLDRKSAETVADLLLELPPVEGAALLVVTHSDRLAARFAEVYELTNGRLEPHKHA